MATGLYGCEPDDRIERCESGMDRAPWRRTRREAFQEYASECAPLYADVRCRNAFLEAANAESENPIEVALAECQKAYCPVLPERRPEACGPLPPSGSDHFYRMWVELSRDVFEHDRVGHGGELGYAYIRFFNELNLRKGVRRGPQRTIPLAAVEQCERGAERAVSLPTQREILRAYYEECAGIYLEADCSAAQTRAADADLDRQVAILVVGCREAYCSKIDGASVDACDGEFVPTASAALHAWPPLQRAILELEAKEYVNRIMRVQLNVIGALATKPRG